MDSMCDKEEKKRTDYSGWVRLLIYIITSALAIGFFKGSVDTHISNKEIHPTQSELMERFVSRREYEMHRDVMTNIQMELRRINDKLDRAIEKGIVK